MSNIEKVDQNFNLAAAQVEGIRFYNVLEPPFTIYGVRFDDGKFRRLPQAVAEKVSSGVLSLHAHTAGGRVRFVTDSERVIIRTRQSGFGRSPHAALTGVAGFDLYAEEDGVVRYVNTFVPDYKMTDGFERELSLKNIKGKKRELTIHFPLYSNVEALYIGLEEGATLEEASPYPRNGRILYYGSSITQGGCASRPGNAYQNMIARRLGMDYWNLGFSGNAKAEDEMAQYVAGLEMDVFVYDYDHNAPDVEHLKNTHEKMYRIIRKANPTLPIVMMTRPQFARTKIGQERYEVIVQTYENARAMGDENVYLLSGSELMKYAKFDGTVDGTHPNDLGFYSMATVLGDLLEEILKV